MDILGEIPTMLGKAAKWGNSVAVRVPRPIADLAALKPGDAVEIHAVPGGLTVRKPSGPRYPTMTLAEMVKEMDRLGAAAAPEIVDWGPDRGAEILRDG